MRFLYKILLLPILTTFLVVIMLDIQLLPALHLLNIPELLKAVWDATGWQALEATGTIAAAVVALWAALRALTRESRREDAQRKYIRRLLGEEVRDNVSQLERLAWEYNDMAQYFSSEFPSQDSGTYFSRILRTIRANVPVLKTRTAIKDQLEGQLELASVSIEVTELAMIEEFYECLDRLSTDVSDYKSDKTPVPPITLIGHLYDVADVAEESARVGQELLASLELPYSPD